MRSNEIIKELNSNGGLCVLNLRNSHLLDKSKQTFNNYVIDYIRWYFNCSRFIAKKVTNYYI